jgi:hypothetical protein
LRPTCAHCAFRTSIYGNSDNPFAMIACRARTQQTQLTTPPPSISSHYRQHCCYLSQQRSISNDLSFSLSARAASLHAGKRWLPPTSTNLTPCLQFTGSLSNLSSMRYRLATSCTRTISPRQRGLERVSSCAKPRRNRKRSSTSSSHFTMPAIGSGVHFQTSPNY